jgi:hypothetical protein
MASSEVLIWATLKLAPQSGAELPAESFKCGSPFSFGTDHSFKFSSER